MEVGGLGEGWGWRWEEGWGGGGRRVGVEVGGGLGWGWEEGWGGGGRRVGVGVGGGLGWRWVHGEGRESRGAGQRRADWRRGDSIGGQDWTCDTERTAEEKSEKEIEREKGKPFWWEKGGGVGVWRAGRWAQW